MTISLSDAGKRYNREWIFRHFTYTFSSGQAYAITGSNGSGKSTLLQSIAGALTINEGVIRYDLATHPIRTEDFYIHLSFCAPYIELVEEMTLQEFLQFHLQFKPILPGASISDIIKKVGLEKAAAKQIRYYSSGMKQRARLAQCIFSDTPVVLLDEPCTNLDQAGIKLYHQLIHDHCNGRLVIVSSNDEVEYRFCKERLNIADYK